MVNAKSREVNVVMCALRCRNPRVQDNHIRNQWGTSKPSELPSIGDVLRDNTQGRHVQDLKFLLR